MPALNPFAALERRANAAVMRHLANVPVQRLDGTGAALGDAVAGIFREPFDLAAGPAAGSAPTVAVIASEVSGLDVGDLLQIGSARWAAAELKPDGLGMLIVVLEVAA